jgi:heme-degrading monooxygenase HmoA
VSSVVGSSDSESSRFVRRVALKVKQDSVQDFISAFADTVIPRTKKSKGIRRLYLLRPVAETNEFVSLTFWDSQEAADAYSKSGTFDANSDQLKQFLEADPALTEYHIEVHEVNAEDLPPPEAAKEIVRRTLRRPISTRGRPSSTTKRKGKRVAWSRK